MKSLVSLQWCTVGQACEILAFLVVAQDPLDDHLIGIVAHAGHLALEAAQHVLKVARPADLREHGVQLGIVHQGTFNSWPHLLNSSSTSFRDRLTDIIEGGSEIRLVDDAILVDVHKLEALLVSGDLFIAEGAEALSLAFPHHDSSGE